MRFKQDSFIVYLFSEESSPSKTERRDTRIWISLHGKAAGSAEIPDDLSGPAEQAVIIWIFFVSPVKSSVI